MDPIHRSPVVSLLQEKVMKQDPSSLSYILTRDIVAGEGDEARPLLSILYSDT